MKDENNVIEMKTEYYENDQKEVSQMKTSDDPEMTYYQEMVESYDHRDSTKAVTYYYPDTPKRQKWCKGKYKNRKEEGVWTLWFKTGEKEWEGNFKDGKEEGICTRWDKEGNVTFTEIWKNGEFVSKVSHKKTS